MSASVGQFRTADAIIEEARQAAVARLEAQAPQPASDIHPGASAAVRLMIGWVARVVQPAARAPCLGLGTANG